MPRSRPRDRILILETAATVVLIAVALASSRPRLAGGKTPARAAVQTAKSTIEPASTQRDNSDEVAGFRLLVTILAGVALGAATSALPSLMSTSASGRWLVAIWLLWAAGVTAVILAYLSTLTGSKVIPNEIGFAHTTALVASFLAQCGLFASLTRPNAQDLVRWWFISFCAFGTAAAIAILLGLLILPKSRRKMDSEALAFYRKGQWGDAAMAGLTAVLSAVYVARTAQPSELSVLCASIIALTSLVVACLKQSLDRRRLRRDGVM